MQARDIYRQFGGSLHDVAASDAALRIALERFGRSGVGTRVENGVLLTRGPAGSGGPYAHAALRLTERTSADEVLGLAAQHADSCGTPVAVWVRSHAEPDLEVAARAAGLSMFGDFPPLAGMVAHQAPPAGDARGHCTVTRAQDLGVVAAVVAAAFAERGISVGAARALIDNPRLLNGEGSHAFIAVADGQPIACAIAFVDAPYGALSYICTVPAARRRGVATAVTLTAMRAASQGGAERLGLQATQEGKALYRRLGFAEVTTYPCYLVSPSPVT